MDKSKENNENDEKIESGTSDIMMELTQAADKVIAEAGEKAGREAEQELERIISEYERKTKQIILKIKEETKTKTAEIAGKLSETIMLRIEQASAEAVTSAVSELSTKARKLTRKMQETAGEEVEKTMGKVAVELGGNAESDDSSALKEGSGIAEIREDHLGQEEEITAEEEGIELKQSIGADDFNQWLTK
ncbi:MAG: hypothetical protein MUO92_02295 [Dehalococcoidales bacterium]|nr:hypothetical protein [Dehalococcoidales bacterium]